MDDAEKLHYCLGVSAHSRQTLTPALSLSEREREKPSTVFAKSGNDECERGSCFLPLVGGERGEPQNDELGPVPRCGLGVVILAAGASSRMGRPKLLLPWGGTSVIGHLLAQWRGLGAEQVSVVCAQANVALDQELDSLQFRPEDRIVNPIPECGMFGSIQCAANWKGWKPTLTHWAICLGDQPHVRPRTLRQLLQFAESHRHRICQPSRNGRGRHPIFLPAAFFKELADARDGNLKEFLNTRSEELALCEIDDLGLDLDMDTPEDYHKALALVTAEN